MLKSSLSGTIVTAPITPASSLDEFPTHLDEYGKGGYRCVATVKELDDIPQKRRSTGMLVYVVENSAFYQLLSDTWKEVNLGEVLSVDSGNDLDKLENVRDGQIVYIRESAELVYYSSEYGWKGFTANIYIQPDPPGSKDALWVDTTDPSIPQYKNDDLASIIESITALAKLVQKHEYAFSEAMVCGGFTNSTRLKLMAAAEPEDPNPEEGESDGGEGEGTATEEEYPDYDLEEPNVNHICIKAGKYVDMTNNKRNFLDNELLWCTDKKELYIMSNGNLVKITGSGGSSGGGDFDPSILQQLETIGFIAPSGQIYKVKVNDLGELIVYKEELDTAQKEPTGGQDDGTGWIYVTTLFLQKLYINSIFCGGISSGEHSYNACSHNFVELSNLTTEDINLNGLSLQYGTEGTEWEVLPLWGVIKAGSTFLIRGAQCSVMDANTTRIKVKTYDMEWVDSKGELIKFDNNKAKFYLTWGTTKSSVKNPYSNTDKNYRVSKGYIDLVGFNKENAISTDVVDASEASPYTYLNSSRLFTKYYTMDPVSQATKALNARNNLNDWYFVDLLKDIIPSVEAYTPKASFENKNIFFNKSKFADTKPNIVNVTFGIQATGPGATRCFNWVSVGYYDEFLWYRKKGDTTWIKQESFKSETGIRKYYNRIRMEATDGTPFTTHKMIVKNLDAGVYEYKVGRPGSDGGPGDYSSDTKEFTVRATTDTESFTFVQVSDQQGFNWDEYQVWRIAAKYIKDNVPENQFTVNTGDMTQNGNRVNEWIDYYNSRQALEDLEEMTTVGNNDLCPANMYVLGNGGDSSKINPQNMSFFYTFEMDESNPPVFTIDGKEVFVDSLYSYNYGKTHFLCVNSEITEMTETNIYGLSSGGKVYESIKGWVEKDVQDAKTAGYTWNIAFCHEMPFTIITQNVIQQFYWQGVENQKVERSGSHLNYNVPTNMKYWFSKFCQENDIRLVLGGHKHTYSVSWPLKENFKEDGTPISMKPIIQVTQSDLQTYFGSDSLYEETEGDLAGQKFPTAWKTDENYLQRKHLCTFELVDKITAPVYAMSQATGYKHTSNKELPAPEIPWLRHYFPAAIKVTDQTTITATVNSGQRYPFYIIWEITPTKITGTVKKINYVFNTSGKFNINIQSSSNDPEAIGGNGAENNGNDPIIIDK